MKAAKKNNIQLLATLVDTNHEEDGEHRFLVDGTHVKYFTVAPGILPNDDWTFGPDMLAGLPPLPPGDWNTGHVGFHSASGQADFLHTAKEDLPGVTWLWHTTFINHLELRKLGFLRQNIHIVSHALSGRPVLAKFTEFSWQTPYLEVETAAYQWIDEADIWAPVSGPSHRGGPGHWLCC